MSEDFRTQARAWLAANAPRRGAQDDDDAPRAAVTLDDQKAFQARLFDAGYAAINWPREYGGGGLGPFEQIAWSQEARNFDLPNGAFFIGISMPGNTILEIGTEAQKKRYLPPMLRGEEIWCQLFSEPGAGSDVASLQTSAVRDGDHWILNGQKVWTSGAQFSDFGAILARTDPAQPKHNGISMFIVDMHAPGVTVRPLRVATGHSPFNEVFFDNVVVPADGLIGEENKGWAAAVVMLRHERIAIGTMGGSRTNPLGYESLRDLAAGLGRTSQPGVRRSLAELYARGRATGLFATLLREEAQAGKMPGARGSVAKLAGSDLGRRAGSLAADILGDQLAAWDAGEIAGLATMIVAAPGAAIAGGTSEIQRNIIGERVLGLAKDPGVDRSTPFNQLRVGTQRQN